MPLSSPSPEGHSVNIEVKSTTEGYEETCSTCRSLAII
jgi:hypothetical protein